MRIFDRAFLIASPLLLISCGDNADEKAAPDGAPAAKAGSEEAMVNDGKLDCALAGAADYTRNCDKEWIVGEQGKMLVIRHPDGGFRRFNVLTDGRGLEVAEGAETAKLVIGEKEMLEVTVGDDRYRLPAQIKANEQPSPETGEAAAKDAAPETEKAAG